MKITDKKGAHCSKPGYVALISLPGVETAYGMLRIQLDVFLSDYDNFSISGMSYLNRREDCGGQITDTLREWRAASKDEVMNEKVDFILKVWEAYHLNDINAGTIEQHEALADMPAFSYPESWYDVACKHLKGKGMYTVEVDGKPYNFGTKWLTHPIPAADLAKIKTFFFPSFFKPERPSIL